MAVNKKSGQDAHGQHVKIRQKNVISASFRKYGEYCA